MADINAAIKEKLNMQSNNTLRMIAAKIDGQMKLYYDGYISCRVESPNQGQQAYYSEELNAIIIPKLDVYIDTWTNKVFTSNYITTVARGLEDFFDRDDLHSFNYTTSKGQRYQVQPGFIIKELVVNVFSKFQNTDATYRKQKLGFNLYDNGWQSDFHGIDDMFKFKPNIGELKDALTVYTNSPELGATVEDYYNYVLPDGKDFKQCLMDRSLSRATSTSGRALDIQDLSSFSTRVETAVDQMRHQHTMSTIRTHGEVQITAIKFLGLQNLGRWQQATVPILSSPQNNLVGENGEKLPEIIFEVSLREDRDTLRQNDIDRVAAVAYAVVYWNCVALKIGFPFNFIVTIKLYDSNQTLSKVEKYNPSF